MGARGGREGELRPPPWRIDAPDDDNDKRTSAPVDAGIIQQKFIHIARTVFT